MRRKYDLEERLLNFTISVLSIIEELPNSYIPQYLFKQAARSSISPSLNYGEALASESRKDFIHKIKVVLKEMRETKNSLEIIIRKNYLNIEKVDPVQNECSQLIAIFTKSVETAKKNLMNEKQ